MHPIAGLQCYTFKIISTIISGKILIDLRAASVISDYTQYIYSRKGIIRHQCLLYRCFQNFSSTFFPESSFRKRMRPITPTGSAGIWSFRTVWKKWTRRKCSRGFLTICDRVSIWKTGKCNRPKRPYSFTQTISSVETLPTVRRQAGIYHRIRLSRRVSWQKCGKPSASSIILTVRNDLTRTGLCFSLGEALRRSMEREGQKASPE